MNRALLAVAAVAALAVATPAAAAKKPLAPGERIDLNQASVSELMRLPGVGRKRAQAIASFRAQHPFHRAEDVTRVKGVSPGWLDRVRGHVTVGAPATGKIAAPRVPSPSLPARPPGHGPGHP